MKQNDWIALNLNIKDTGIDIDSLRLYNITPDNTGLRDKDYYRTIPQVQQAFTDSTTGLFDESAFEDFYNSAKRSYTNFVSNDYARDLINSLPSSKNDIFSLGNVNLHDDSAYIFSSRDVNRHTMGIGNIFETGAPTFSEREVAQANKVVDENGNQLDWSPNDKGGLLKALFRPNLALAQYDKDEYDDNGNLIHHKGEHKYNEYGDPYYEILGNKEIYGRDVLRYADTLTKEGTWLNKIDIFDRDGLKTSPGQTVLWTIASIAPFLTPYGYAFGALKAAIDLGQTIPVMAKMLNGFITNDDTSEFSKQMTSVENFFSRFGRSESDYARQHRWRFEGVAQMVVDSAGQLYSQRLIQKIPQYLSDLKKVHLTEDGIRRAQALSSAYMATTSAKEVYGEYRQAGLNPAMSGAGAFATMMAYYLFMQNSYFKDMLFRDAAIEMPELKILLNRTVKTTQDELVARQLANEGLEKAAIVTKELIANPEKKWYKTVYNAVGGALKKAWPTIKSISTAESPYLYTSRSLNEGIEEVMEEGVSDFFKGLSLGLNAMGIDVKDKYAEKIDFNWTPENFLERYATALVGGTIGGAVFEGLTQWDNKVLHRNITRVSDLEDLDEQMDWYIRNNYGKDLLKLIDQYENKGKTGTKDLSWNYTIQDGKIVYDAAKGNNSQSAAIANIIRERIKYKMARLETLGLNISDNEVVLKAMTQIADDAKEAGYTDLEKYQREKLRDARVDFLKATGVDKFIITDVADFQKALTKLEETIEDKKAELQNVPDNLKSEQPKDTPEIKRLQKQYDNLKKRLNNILEGKAASEYLQTSMYLSDESLYNLYTSDLTGENDTWYEQSIANYTRARWGENYNELDDQSKALMQAEYDEWKKAQKRKDRVRYAYNMHQFLSDTITPIIQRQIQNYSGYKLEEGRGGMINGLLADAYTEQQQTLAKQIADLVSNGGDPDEVLNLTTQLDQINKTLDYIKSPLFVLDDTYDSESEENPFFGNYERAIKNFDTSTMLDLIVDYYKNLNSSKTVSEFSDDILKRTLALIGERSKLNFDTNIASQRKSALNDLNSIYDDAFMLLIRNQWMRPELATVFHDIVDAEGNVQKKSEAQILQDLWNAHLDQLRVISRNEDPNADGKFTYNGKTRYLIDHLFDANILSAIGVKTKLEDPDTLETYDGIINPFTGYYNTFQNVFQRNAQLLDAKQFKELISLGNSLSNAFTKDIDTISSNYTALYNALENLAKQNGVDQNALVASLMFDNDVNVLNKLQQLKQLRAEMIHTPILEWIQAMSVQLKGQPTNLWNMLTNEIKGLQSKRTLEEYTINDPFALQELNFLQGALISAQAVLRGAMPGGVNIEINKLREEDGLNPLIVIEDQNLYDVYQNDLDLLSMRVAYLLDLHEKNHYGTVKQKKQTFIKNAPKFVEALLKRTSTSVNEERPETFIASKLSDIGIENIADLWTSVGGDNIVLSDVNENNFEEFWKVYRAFQNAIYDKVNEWNPSEGNKIETIAKTLVSGFTDVWKMKTSNLTTLESSKVENYDVLMWLAQIIAVDPRITHGLIKTVKSNTGITPFFDQSLGIELGFATLENDALFNAIVDELAKATVAALNNLDISKESKLYLEYRAKIYNAIFVDGSSGTGKSQVELRFIKEMRNLLHPGIKSIAVSEHEERAIGLKNALHITDTEVYSKIKLFELLLGRELTSDDFAPGKTNEGEDSKHVKVLSDKTLQEIRKKTNNWKPLYGDSFGLDVYIDESGFLSEGDFQLLTESIGLNNVHFIYAGDEMQNGCVIVQSDKSKVNSGTFDIVGIKSIRLNLSMRAGNLGMVKNLQHLEAQLKQFLDLYWNEPWLSSKDLTTKVKSIYGDVTPYKFNFYEDEDNLYGIRFVDDASSALEKLKRISKKVENVPSIVIITDNVDKWKNQRSSDIDVLTVEQVQGGEYQFALIDIENFGNNQDFDYLRNIYTLISRARKGVYINGEIGSWFPKTNNADADVTASIEVNPTANENEQDPALIDYGEFFDKLYENDVWSSSNPLESPTNPTNPTNPTKPPITLPNPKGPIVPKVESEIKPGLSEFNLDTFLDDIAKNGSKSQFLQGYFIDSKTKRSDYDNYQKYMQAIDRGDQRNGRTIFTKDFIDWLNSDDSDELIINGSRSMLRGFTALTETKKAEYKDLLKGFALDLIQLNKDELREKYVNDVELKAKWSSLYENNVKWDDLVSKVFQDVVNAKTDNNKLNVYSVRDGKFAYLYWISNGFAFPIARVENLNEIGALQLSLTQFTPQIILSTNGQQFKPLSEVVGKYADVSEEAYVIAISPNKIPTTPETGVTRFVSEMIGNPLALISSIFYQGRERALLQREVDDKGIVHRIDQTGKTNGRRRFSGVSNFVTLTKWLRLANTLRRIQSHDITSANDPDVRELQNYLNNQALESVIKAIANPSAAETLSNLSRATLLSPTSRDLLTTALLRYFFIHRDKVDDYNRFIEHLSKWNRESYKSNDGKYIRQPGFSFNLYGINGSIEEYHILQDENHYNIVTKGIDNGVFKEVVVGTLTAKEWLNIDGFDVVSSVKTVLNKIRFAKSNGLVLQPSNTGLFQDDVLGNFFNDEKSDISDEQIEALFKDGTITVGLATRSEEIQIDKNVIKNQNVAYFAPFDYNIAELLDDIHILENDKLDKFLKSDTKFKYNFLVGVPATSETTNSDWMHTDPARIDVKQMLTDIGLILPPSFTISVGRSNYAGFTGLGSLDHRVVTSNPSENQLTIKEQNGKNTYTLQKNFIVDQNTFKEYVDIDLNSPEIEIIRATSDSITINDNGLIREFRTKKDPKLLFDGMPTIYGEVGDQIVLQNENASLIKDNSSKLYLRVGKNKYNSPKVVYETDQEIAYIGGHNMFVFKKNNSDSISNNINMLIPDSRFIGQTDDADQLELYYLKDTSLLVYNVTAHETTVYQNIILVNDTLKSNGEPVWINENIIKKLKYAGVKSQTARGDKRSEALKEFARKHGLSEDEITSKMNNNQINSWLRSRAIELGAIYKWDKKNNEFVEQLSEQDKVLMEFAKWVENEHLENQNDLPYTAQMVIDSNPEIVINGNDDSQVRFAEIKLPISGNVNNKFTFKLLFDSGKLSIELNIADYVPEPITVQEYLRAMLGEQFSMLSSTDISNIVLYAKQQLGYNVDTNTDEYINWVTNMSEIVANAISLIDSTTNNVDQNTACTFKFD